MQKLKFSLKFKKKILLTSYLRVVACCTVFIYLLSNLSNDRVAPKGLACTWVLPQTHTATNTIQSTLYKTSTKQIIIGLRQLCRHNFEHNRQVKASSIMSA